LKTIASNKVFGAEMTQKIENAKQNKKFYLLIVEGIEIKKLREIIHSSGNFSNFVWLYKNGMITGNSQHLIVFLLLIEASISFLSEFLTRPKMR
jgi:hypothetical protein